MLRTLSITGALAALLFAGSGCVVRGQVRTSAYVSTPELVMVQPGVYVMADYDQPVFYTDGYYWLYRDGFWFRSGVYSGGWVRVRNVPVAVHRIHRPHAYVHYHARGNARVYRAPARRGEPVRRVETRDHRTDRRERAYRR